MNEDGLISELCQGRYVTRSCKAKAMLISCAEVMDGPLFVYLKERDSSCHDLVQCRDPEETE